MPFKKKKVLFPKRRSESGSLGDVSLADFADAAFPIGSGRVSKSVINLRLRSLNEDSDCEDESVQSSAVALPANNTSSDADRNDSEHLIPYEVWILLSEYMRPEDVVCFSLICRHTYHIMNAPLFWVKLYNRYYTSKVFVPSFLKKHCLERHLGLKAKVVRSLYYTYPAFRESLRRSNRNVEALIGYWCELMLVQLSCDKEIDAEVPTDQCTSKRWMYRFRMRNRPSDFRTKLQPKLNTTQDKVNHNPEDSCRVLEIICKEYVNPKCVIGMKLRKVAVHYPYLQLRFSSAPLSRFGTDFDAIDIYLLPLQPPSIYGWWHPQFSVQ